MAQGHQYLLAPTVGVLESPLDIRTGGDTKPGRVCSTRTVEARPGTSEVHKQVWKMGEVPTLS